MNSKQELKLQQLLRLKRHESPGKPYFDHFLAEFHRYQRADLLESPSKWQEWKTNLTNFLFARPVRTFAYSSSFATVVLLAVVGLSPSTAPSDKSVSAPPSSYHYAEATEEALRHVEINPISLSAFDRDFNAPRFVTGERTLAYENTVAF